MQTIWSQVGIVQRVWKSWNVVGGGKGGEAPAWRIGRLLPSPERVSNGRHSVKCVDSVSPGDPRRSSWAKSGEEQRYLRRSLYGWEGVVRAWK